MCFGLEGTETCKMCGMSSEVEGRYEAGARDWASCPSLPAGGQLCGVGLILSFGVLSFPMQVIFRQAYFSFMPHAQ